MNIKFFNKIVILIFIICLIVPLAYSYSAFDNKYTYQTNNSSFVIPNNSINDDTEILFIVDFSVSMNKPLGDVPRINHAVNAINSILKESASNKKIGLRVFGLTNKPIHYFVNGKLKFHKDNICKASSLVIPIARYNAKNISQKLNQLYPKGGTPIGYALRQAVQNDFSFSKNLKHIILVTDGVETCGDDPCLYIKRLMQQRNDIRIDVIGITIEENGYSQLNCIAAAANGKYYSVNSPEDFKVMFKEAFKASDNFNVKFSKDSNFNTNFAPQSNYQTGIKYKNYAYAFTN